MVSLPVLVELYPSSYTGYPFITLIEHNQKSSLVIVDNYTNSNIQAYVLDLCAPLGIKEMDLISIAEKWYADSAKYPLSVEISRLNQIDSFSKIVRTFHADDISRVVGFLPHYNFSKIHKIRRRRKRVVPLSVNIKR